MATGLRAFRKIQISNVENSPGTAEAATEQLRGVLTQPYTDEIFHTPDQDRGLLSLHVETPFELQREVNLDMSGVLYDRLAVFMFSNAIRGNVTPTQPDAVNEPNHYLWTFAPGLTTANTPSITNGIDTFTLEYGDNIQAYETSYLFTTQLVIEGIINEPVTFMWSITGQQVTETSFTGGLSVPPAASFQTNNAKFYIDTTFAGIGSTQKTSMLRAFTWTFETQFTPLFAADGTFVFAALDEARKTATLELTYDRDDTNSEAEKDRYEAQSIFYPRIRLEAEGEMDSGQSNPEYINIDGAYRYTDWPDTDDDSGIAIETVTAKAFYDSTSSKMIEVDVGTTMSAFA